MIKQPRSDGNDELPATYRQVFGNTELSALFGSFALSKASSMLARVAITFLVFNATGSPFLAAAAFGLSYLPYLGPAQLLATLADRLPYRTTMIIADLVRMVMIGLVAVPGMPLPVMLVLVFAAAMVEPAYQSSRSALMPKLVTGEVLTLALSVHLTLNQTAQLAGYFLGGVIASINPRVALLVNSAAYAVSALILVTWVRRRPAAVTDEPRKRILRETAEGFRLVFGDRVLRMIALVVFVTVTFTIVPEGAAAAWSHEVGGGAVLQGLIMASAPVAAILATIIFTRFMRPTLRQKLIKPLVLLAPLSLLPALFQPPGWLVVGIAVVCNLTVASQSPLNAIFVQAVPDGYRARAFSVMQSGLTLAQGFAVVVTGALAQTPLATSQGIGVWAIAGVVAVGALLVFWPSSQEFDAAVAAGTAPDRSTDRPDRELPESASPGRPASEPATG